MRFGKISLYFVNSPIDVRRSFPNLEHKAIWSTKIESGDKKAHAYNCLGR